MKLLQEITLKYSEHLEMNPELISVILLNLLEKEIGMKEYYMKIANEVTR